MRVKRKDLLTPAIERGRKRLLWLLKAEGGVVELENRGALRLIMKRNRVFIVKIGNEEVVPIWQFNDRVYPNMPQILKILKSKTVSDLSIMIFFLNKNLRCDGKTQLQALREGKVKDVMRAAMCYLEHGAA